MKVTAVSVSLIHIKGFLSCNYAKQPGTLVVESNVRCDVRTRRANLGRRHRVAEKNATQSLLLVPMSSTMPPGEMVMASTRQPQEILQFFCPVSLLYLTVDCNALYQPHVGYQCPQPPMPITRCGDCIRMSTLLIKNATQCRGAENRTEVQRQQENSIKSRAS